MPKHGCRNAQSIPHSRPSAPIVHVDFEACSFAADVDLFVVIDQDVRRVREEASVSWLHYEVVQW